MFALPVNLDQQRRKFFGGGQRHRLRRSPANGFVRSA